MKLILIDGVTVTDVDTRMGGVGSTYCGAYGASGI
jgi:hypothetical protein